MRAGNHNDNYSSPPVRLRLDQSRPDAELRAARQLRPDQGRSHGRPTGSQASPVASIEISRRGLGLVAVAPDTAERRPAGRANPGRGAASRPATCCAPGRATWPETSARRPAPSSTFRCGSVRRCKPASRQPRPTVIKKRGKGKKTRRVRRKVRRKRDRASPQGLGQVGRCRPTIAGRLANRDGQPIPGQAIQVLGPGPNGEQLLATLTTDAKAGSATAPPARAAAARCASSTGQPGGAARRRRRWPCAVSAAGSFKRVAQRILNGGRVVVPRPRGQRAAAGRRQARRDPGTPAHGRVDHLPLAAHRRPGHGGRCATASPRPPATPATGCGPGSRPRPATHSPPATRRPRSVLVRGAEGPCP